MNQMIGIRGAGYSLPPYNRQNDDPVFSYLKSTANAKGIAERDLFTGMQDRRYLTSDEDIETYMVNAAQSALQSAGLAASEIDRLYGSASLSVYHTPNGLYRVHRDLQMPEYAFVVPLNIEFSTFLMGVIQASEAIRSGRSQHALVVVGSNWTRHMDYTQGHSLSIGDGAGAALVTDKADWIVVDYLTQTVSDLYGSMTMGTRVSTLQGQSYMIVNQQNIPVPTYHITENEGFHTFQVTAMHGLPAMVEALLRRHHLQGSDVALMTHQASRVLMDHWAERLQVREYLDTLASFGNMTSASCPVTFAYHYHQIQADYLVMAALGVGYHQTALLFKRA